MRFFQDVERKAAALLQALARRILAHKVTELLFGLRGDLRRVLEATTNQIKDGAAPSDSTIEQVEAILKRSNSAYV